jgi:hypothetical protein
MIIDDKVYGRQEVVDPLVVELLCSSELERLKGVGQYGTWSLMDKRFDTTRFEHSFGVYCLLRHFGAAEEEMIAGLLHDVNHTAFSHVVDYVFGDSSIQNFGDSKHHDIIMGSNIPSLLEKREVSVGRVCDPHNFGLLERDLPDLCCDRIDYCLRDSLCCGFIDQKGAAEILGGLVVHNGEIICKDRASASRIAGLFLKTSRFLWSNEVQTGSFSLLAEALKIAIREGVITVGDLYTTDDILFGKLMDSGNSEIAGILKSLRREAIIIGTQEDYDIFGKSKARYIDPKFFDSGKIVRLSDVDKGFKKEVDDLKDWIAAGFYIKVVR